MQEIAYLAYDDKAAEYDLIGIARRLSSGIARRQTWWQRLMRHRHQDGEPSRLEASVGRLKYPARPSSSITGSLRAPARKSWHGRSSPK
jgi:hypothetical protein